MCKKEGNYTVVNREASKMINHPQNRKDFKKTVSNVTINEGIVKLVKNSLV